MYTAVGAPMGLWPHTLLAISMSMFFSGTGLARVEHTAPMTRIIIHRVNGIGPAGLTAAYR